MIAAGLLLRVALVVGLPQPLLTFTDPNAYVRAAQDHLFHPLEGRTPGYPLVLRLLHDAWPSIAVPMVLNHLLALVACAGLYAIGRRLGLTAGLAVVAAVLWAIPVDWLWLEHQLMTETVATALVVAAVAAATAFPYSTVRRAAIIGVACAVLIAAAVSVRPALLAVVPGLALALALVAPRPTWRLRPAAAAVAAFGVTFVVIAAAYVAAQEHQTGYRGLIGPSIDMGAYAGMAPLAECSRFEVPAGTDSLCQSRPPRERPLADFYYFDARSPGRRLAADRPDLLPAIDEWGSRAAEAQAGDLWRSRLSALGQLLGLADGNRFDREYGPRDLRLDGASRRSAPVTAAAVADYYGTGAAQVPGPRWSYRALSAIQPWTRPPRLLLLAALLITAAGVLFGRGWRRRATIALGTIAWLPPLSATYIGGQFYTSVPSGQFVWRYAVPSLPFIGLAAAIATAELLRRVRAAGGPGERAAQLIEKS